MRRASWILLLLGIALVLCRAQGPLEEGEKHFRARDYDKAIVAFQNALRKVKEEDKARVNLLLGQCYLGKKDYDSAIDVLSEVISQSKDDAILAPAYFNRGLAYEGKGWLRRAMNDFRQAIKRAKEDKALAQEAQKHLDDCQSLYKRFEVEESSYLQRVDMLLAGGDKDGAANLLREFARRCVEWGDIDKAIDYEKEAMDYSTTEEFKAGGWMNIGWRYVMLRNYEEAGKAFKKVVDDYPKSEFAREALLRAGDMFSKAGKKDDAIKCYKEFIQRYPQSEQVPQAMMGIALCYYEKKDYDNAISAYKEFIQRYPQSEQVPQAMMGIALCYYEKKDYDNAISAYKEFIQRYPQREEVPQAMMGVAWSYWGKKDYNQSAEWFKQVVDKYGDREEGREALLRLGDAYSMVGKNEEAVKVYQEYLQKYPNDERAPNITMNIAWRYRIMDDKKAQELLKQISEKYPDTEIGWMALGVLNEDTHQYDKAIEAYKKAAEFHGPQRSTALYGIATCYMAIGMLDEARKYYKMVAEEFPQSDVGAPSVHFQGLTLMDTGHYEEATSYFHRVIKEYPDNIYALLDKLFLATTYEHLFDFRKAIEEYSGVLEVVKQSGVNPPPHLAYLKSFEGMYKLRVGACYLNLGEIDKAKEVWSNIKKENPDLKWAGLVGERLVKSLEKIKEAYGGNLPKIERVDYTPPAGRFNCIAGVICARNFGLSRGVLGRYILVYGTQGTKEEEEAGLFVAQQLKRRELDLSRMEVDIKKDTEVTEKDIANCPLVLIGTPCSNKIIEEIKDKLPIKVDKEHWQIIVKNRKYWGKDVGMIMVHPNPLNPQQYVVLIEGLTPDSLKFALNIYHEYKHPLMLHTDYLIYDDKSGGPEKPVLEEGFFLKRSISDWEPL